MKRKAILLVILAASLSLSAQIKKGIFMLEEELIYQVMGDMTQNHLPKALEFHSEPVIILLSTILLEKKYFGTHTKLQITPWPQG